MKCTLLGLIVSCCLCSGLQAQTDTLLNRYRQYLFRVEQPAPTDWANTLNGAGQWPDIDYNNKDLAVWQVSLHLQRVRRLAFLWAHPASPSYQDAQLLEKALLALDHWLLKRYRNDNWWHNEIGVPRLMREIILLLRNELSPERFRQCLEVMAQFRLRKDFVGGNLIWCADLGMLYGALTGNDSLIRHCRNWMLEEIRITTGEGIQPDHSFHQHGKRLQQYQYGRAYLVESTRIAWQCRGTSWAFPEEKVNILVDFMLEGCQWMARGIYTVPGTIDRSASRRGELQKSADLRYILPFMIALQPHKAAALNKMLSIQNGAGDQSGFRYYPYSDFAVFHRPAFSYFLKTISSRTLATESINSENFKGKLLNSGDGYLIRNGSEYTDLLPLWDWESLPGVTMVKGAHAVNRKSFVGSTGDGTDGLSVMDYELRDSTAQTIFAARKFWACYRDTIICLIKTMHGKNAYTALDQCRWQGDVTVNGKVLKSGEHRIQNVQWIHHAGFAYIPLQPSLFHISMQQVRGNWTTINASETKEPVEAALFVPRMLHTGASTGYSLAPCKTAAAASALARQPGWQVLRNEEDCQAIRFNDNTLMAAFYAPTTLTTKLYGAVQTDQPCLLLIKNGRVFASDPAHTGLTVNITVSDRRFRLVLPADGTTIAGDLVLPAGNR